MSTTQRGYLTAVTALGAVATALVVAGGLPAPTTLAVFGALAVGTELLSVRLPNGATASALMIPVVGAIHALGAEGSYLAGGLVAGVGGLYLPDLRHRRLDRVAFNAAQLVVAGVAAAAVYGLLAPATSDATWRLLAGGLGAGAAFLVVNVGLLTPMLALCSGSSVRSVVRSFDAIHLQYVPFALTGAAVGWLAQSVGLLAAPLAVVPVVVARQTFTSFLDLKAAHEGTLRILVEALQRKDPYTAGHVERVARYAGYIGEELGLSDVRLERLRYGALMHDIGKLVVANELLNKPDRLTPEEYERVRFHETVSVELLRRIDFLAPIAASASPRYARFDAGEAGGPIEPYIIVVADAYDAMTSTRPYRQALTQATAFEELRRHSGGQFHPLCVEALLAALERREERHGYGYEEEIVVFDRPPPPRGPGSAGLGDLAPETQSAGSTGSSGTGPRR